MGCGRERHRGARRVLIKDVEDDPSGKRLNRTPLAVGREISLTAIENRVDLRVGQRIDGEKIHERVAYCGGGRLASASIAP